MKKAKLPNGKLKKAIKRLLIHNKNPYIDPPSKYELNNKIKYLIETNRELNHRFMDFNYLKEYKQMRRTMNKFNSEQNVRKDLVSKLSKENNFFTKSYSNIIASLAIKLDNKSINYHTISNFNKKYEHSLSPSRVKENNFFYEDPLLLTKSKDLDNFYLNEKHPNAKKDTTLNYSKKLLLSLNSNSPLNRVLKTVEQYNKKIYWRSFYQKGKNKMFMRNNYFYNNSTIQNEALTDRNTYYLGNKKKNRKVKKEYYEIKNLINENNEIKKIINLKTHDRRASQINANISHLLSSFNYKYINSKENKKDSEILSKKVSNDILSRKNGNPKKTVRYNGRFSSVNIIRNLYNNFEEDNSINDILNQKSPVFINNNLKSIIPKDDAFKRTMNKKLSKIKKLKGSIHIQNIYNDLVKTKENVSSYQNKKEPKLKFLYSLFSNKKAVPFQKEDKENYKIKKLDRDLFWTVNEFHNN